MDEFKETRKHFIGLTQYILCSPHIVYIVTFCAADGRVSSNMLSFDSEGERVL